MQKVNRKKTRKLLFQKLYSSCFSEYKKDSFYESFVDNVLDFDIDNKYIDEMYEIILYNQDFFIPLIERYSPRFDIQKMNIMYVLPIYIALAEMFFLKEEIPPKVSINESVEIAKAFGDNSAKKIVNGVLNKVYQDYDDLKSDISNIKKDIKYSLFV